MYEVKNKDVHAARSDSSVICHVRFEHGTVKVGYSVSQLYHSLSAALPDHLRFCAESWKFITLCDEKSAYLQWSERSGADFRMAAALQYRNSFG